jgi:hypothetical protein
MEDILLEELKINEEKVDDGYLIMPPLEEDEKYTDDHKWEIMPFYRGSAHPGKSELLSSLSLSSWLAPEPLNDAQIKARSDDEYKYNPHHPSYLSSAIAQPFGADFDGDFTSYFTADFDGDEMNLHHSPAETSSAPDSGMGLD